VRPPLRLLALDLSLASPGYAWTTTPAGVPHIGLDRRPGAPWVACETIPAPDGGLQESIEAVRFRVNRLLTVRPHLVAIEDIFTGKNPRTAIKLAKLHGVVEHEIWEAKTRWVIINQQYRAMYATGRGNAPKADVLTAARYVYGRFVGGAARIRTTDDADALILLAMTADWYGYPLVEVDDTKRRALIPIAWPRLMLSADPHVPSDESAAGIARSPNVSPGYGSSGDSSPVPGSGVGSSAPVPAARFSAAYPKETQ